MTLVVFLLLSKGGMLGLYKGLRQLGQHWTIPDEHTKLEKRNREALDKV